MTFTYCSGSDGVLLSDDGSLGEHDQEYVLLSDAKRERIICAGVQLPSGTLSLGRRHAECMGAAIASGEVERVTQDMQGFLTSEGRFVNRIEAMELARDAGQLIGNTTRNYLMSEDLW